MAWGAALPGLVIWGMGIPAAIYWLMSREERNLDTNAVRIQFGFLYNGYKRDNYHWEIVIMYRKIFSLMIAIFLTPLGVICQASFLIIFLMVFQQMNTMKRPYLTRQLNDTEDLSILAQLLTVSCGLLFE